MYLLERGLNPYDGGPNHHPPLLLFLSQFLNSLPRFKLLGIAVGAREMVWRGAEIITAGILGKMVQRRKGGWTTLGIAGMWVSFCNVIVEEEVLISDVQIPLSSFLNFDEFVREYSGVFEPVCGDGYCCCF